MDSRLVALKNVKKDFRFNCKSFIIDNNTLIDINSWVGKSGLVEYFAFERVLDIVSNIIVGEGDDLVLRETVLFENVVSVVDVGLVTVVGVCAGPGDEDGPIVRGYKG